MRGNRRESSFFYSPKKAQRQMAQIRGSLDGWILNNVLLPWQRIVCSELCDDFVLPGESTTARREKKKCLKMATSLTTRLSHLVLSSTKRTIRSCLAYLLLSVLSSKSHRQQSKIVWFLFLFFPCLFIMREEQRNVLYSFSRKWIIAKTGQDSWNSLKQQKAKINAKFYIIS